MKMRPVFLVLLLVGGFWYLTSHLSNGTSFWPLTRASGSGAGLQLTEAEAAPAYDAEELNNIAVYKRVLPSVVNITSKSLVYNFFFEPVPQQGQGSGFILDKAGHVLTNFHVVQGANRGIKVKLSNKRTYDAKVVGTDQVHDLALLQIDAPNLQPVTLADSSEPGRGPEGLRHRQSLRPQRHHDARHHQLHPLDRRLRGRAHRGRHPDRRGDQSRQLRRPAAELARRGDRHQHHDRLERRRPELGHRLCHSHQHGQGGAGRPDPLRARQAALAGHRFLCHRARSGLADGPGGRFRRSGAEGHPRRRGRAGRHARRQRSRPMWATRPSCWAAT